MNDRQGQVIDITGWLQPHVSREPQRPDGESLRNLAYQAVKLPNTLSKSEIETLGRALLSYADTMQLSADRSSVLGGE